MRVPVTLTVCANQLESALMECERRFVSRFCCLFLFQFRGNCLERRLPALSISSPERLLLVLVHSHFYTCIEIESLCSAFYFVTSLAVETVN